MKLSNSKILIINSKSLNIGISLKAINDSILNIKGECLLKLG